MPNFTGIYDSSEESSHFIFLDINPEIKGDLISSLQSFETSLILISIGRWTNALISITNAIEILIREFTKEERDFYLLIDDFAASYKISIDLKSALHRVRKKRNEFTHSAIMPDDNNDAIKAYLVDALSVYKVFIQKSAKIDLYESIYESQLRENLIFTKNDVKKYSDDESIGHRLAILVKTISNMIHIKLTPEAMYYLPDENMSFEAREQFEQDRDERASFFDGPTIHDIVTCPSSCEGLLSVEVEVLHQSEEEFQKKPIGSAHCPRCGLFILPESHLKKYVHERLSAEQIQNIKRLSN